MSEIHWHETRPEEVGRVGSIPVDDGILLHNGIPDWVKVPDTSPLYPGDKRRVRSTFTDFCPVPSCVAECRHLVLSGPGDLLLAPCTEHGMILYQRVDR